MNDLQNIHEGFNMHNKASGSLDSVVRANLGEGGSAAGSLGNEPKPTTDLLVGNKIESNTERGVIGSTLLSGQESVARGLDVIGAKPVNDMLSGMGIPDHPFIFGKRCFESTKYAELAIGQGWKSPANVRWC